MVIDKFTITSPPNTLFSGISTNYKDNLTYVEYLLGVIKKINELIVQVNQNTEFIEQYDGRIDEVEAEIENLRQEITEFEAQVESDFTKFSEEITAGIDTKFNQIRNELISLLYQYRAESKAYTDTKFSQLEAEIDEILIGQITILDPTTGIYSPLQTVINNIYDTTRTDALSATEYDGLELTASTYDGYEITAFNYDQFGKTILSN